MASASAKDSDIPSTSSACDFQFAHRVSFKEDAVLIPGPGADTVEKSNKRHSGSTLKPSLKESNVANRNGRNTARSEEEDPWVPQYTLCLDGGGIRGMSTLLILRRLMDVIKEVEQTINPAAASSTTPYMFPGRQRRDAEPITKSAASSPTAQSSIHTIENSAFLPCHYFDYIAGTSTGGLIAIMLSRLRMTVDECLEEYTILGNEVFGRPRAKRVFIPRSLKLDSLEARTGRLERMLRTIVESKGSKESVDKIDHFASRPDSCRTIVVTVRKSSSSSVPYLLRTYNHPTAGEEFDPLERNPGDPLDCSVWEAARATSAAPTYFKAVRIKGQKFLDGGLVSNNPTWLVMNEVCQMHGSRDSIDLCLSIGTGCAPVRSKNGISLTRVLMPYKVGTPRQSQEQVGLEIEDGRYERCKYERFDIGSVWDVGSTKSEWKLWRSDSTMDSIRNATSTYLNRQDIKKSLEEVAQMLVRQRRLRAKTSRWETFVFGVNYRCEANLCPTPQKLWKNRDELVAHMQRSHNQESPGPDNIDAIEEMLERCKTRQWSYDKIAIDIA
ncbi:uncharacterized protein PAC_15528 [Phialocephala subalpina]|uniref:PNPLA domain-containing protein n=1 Tax=Phialocephala subalpina TaxID=576137 RepID=A0A1L7XKT3_9HELO|nr:uncharacterized protein PAC_15528 [Phialocephala subalpina]